MLSALRFATASIVLTLIGGLLLASGVFTPERAVTPAVQTESPSPSNDAAPTFPTGLFVATKRDDLHLEFLEDGAGRSLLHPGTFEASWTYAIHGDLFTEMAHDSPLGSDRQVPATYYWDWDGELLSFELWGEELNPNSRGATMNYDFRLIPDARMVVVANMAIPLGGLIYPSQASLHIVPIADVDPEMLTSLSETFGRRAAVAIEEGRPITPDLLEPAE